MDVRFLILALVAVTLAGCSEDATSTAVDCFENPAADGCGPDIDPNELDTGKGVIRGVVIDSSITPIVDATVSVVNTELVQTTDENGGFVFVNVEPGTYFLEVNALGFNGVQQSADVVGGVPDPAIVKILLTPNPTELPFVVSQLHDAFISCGFKTANFVWGANSCDPAGVLGYSASDDSAHTFEMGTSLMPEHYQTEIQWEANQLLSEGLVTIQCATDNTGCGSGVGSDRMCNVRGASPLVCSISADTPSEEVPGGGNNFTTVRDGEGFDGLFTIGLFANCSVQCDPAFGTMGLGVAVDQKVHMYANVFYNFRPVEGWTFVNDGSYPTPN